MFLRQIAAVFLARTSPASSIENPAAMNITKTPCTRNAKVLKTKAVSCETAAAAGTGATASTAAIKAPMRTYPLLPIIPRSSLPSSCPLGRCQRSIKIRATLPQHKIGGFRPTFECSQ
jgi:hypothetical protein